MDYLRIEDINVEKDFNIKIALLQDKDLYIITIDGVQWLTTENEMHAVCLFTMMKEHILEYMHYEKIK